MRLTQTGGHYRRLVIRLPRSKTNITALRKQKFHAAVIGFGLKKQSLFLRKYPTLSKETITFSKEALPSLRKHFLFQFTKHTLLGQCCYNHYAIKIVIFVRLRIAADALRLDARRSDAVTLYEDITHAVGAANR